MKKPMFIFSDLVVVDDGQIGCIVKTWGASEKREIHYEVYVRNYNGIVEYNESDIVRYSISKELHEDEHAWH